MSVVRQHAFVLAVHVLLLAVYAFVIPTLHESAESPLRTVLGFVVFGTSLSVIQSVLAARTAPVEHTLRASIDGRAELLWRTANDEPRLLKVEGWPSWTLQAYRYGTFGLGMAAALAAVIFTMRRGDALTFSEVPVMIGLVALAAGLPLLLFRALYDRWAGAHPDEVAELLSSPETINVQKAYRRMGNKEKR